MQIFLQGKLLGIEEFLLAPAASDPDRVFLGRSHWISLLSEVLPRAVLAELGLAKILLGSSGGGQFLILLPEEARSAAEALLEGASAEITSLSGGTVRLIWSATENLGDWSDVRKRLSEQMESRRGAPGFSPEANEEEVKKEDAASPDTYFADVLGWNLREVKTVGWSPESPGRIQLNGGRHVWELGRGPDALPFVHHTALDESGARPASSAELAGRAKGLPTWGVLRGDADNFGIRIRRAQTIEEHIQLSVMYKQFIAGELDLQCSLPEYFRNVTVIYSGGDDFAVMGAWDALIGLAREMERVFHLFASQNLKEFAGMEAKTVTMALAVAPAADASLAAVFEEAGRRLESAKAGGKDSFWLLGRTLEWRQFTEAVDLKDLLLRMISDYDCSPQYLRDICGIYRETQAKMSKRQARRMGGERPWRYHRRLRRILSAARPAFSSNSARARQDYLKARTALIADLIGRSAVTVK